MRSLPGLVTLCLLLALTACGGPATEKTIYIPPDSAGGQLCAAHCSEAHNYCREDCSLHERECTNQAQGQAIIDYEKYMSAQFLHANAIEYRMRDFEHLEPCESDFNACAAACETPYQACYENCGGEVETTTSCQFLCF